jgi:hypothetical protein
VVGRMRLCCGCDPLASLAPSLRIQVTAGRPVERALEHLMRGVLLQYVPAGVLLLVRWRIADLGAAESISAAGIKLDDNGPGRLGADSALGRTVVAGRAGNRLDEVGLEIGFRLP